MIRSALLFVVVALVGCGGSKPTPTPPAPPGDVGPRETDLSGAKLPAVAAKPALPLWPEVKKGTLPNGLTYYILKHGKPEKRAFLWLAVNAGSVLEDDDQQGLAHFHEHMSFNGTKRFPKAEIINYLEKIGMRFGADLNAYTSYDQTVYQLEVPTDNAEFVGKGLDILRDWAGDVSDEPVEVEKERGVVLEEWRLGRGAFQRLRDKQGKVLYKGSRYAERNPIGQPDIIKTASRDVLNRFYRDWYRPDLMAVIAVGDVDTAVMEKAIQARFGDLKNPAHERARFHAEVPKADGTRVSIETDRELPLSLVSVSNMLPHRPQVTLDDFRRVVVEQVYTTILNERLAVISRRGDAPFAGAGAGIQSNTREIDSFTRTAQVKGGKVEDALKSLFTEVLRVEKHGFTQTELDRARTILSRRFEQAAAEESTADSRQYTDEITRNFFQAELMIGRVAEKETTLKLLPTITLSELNSLAATFGGADNRVIAIAGPEGQPQPTKERILAIVNEIGKTAIEPWEDKAVTTALMAVPPKPGTIKKETKIASLGTTEWLLSNGVRVIAKPTDFEADQVAISGSSPGGLAMAKDKEFANARHADALAQIGGVGELDVESLGKVLAGKHVSVEAGIEETTESVDGSASSRDLETMFQLVHLVMGPPRKDAEAIAVWRANAAEGLANRLRVPEVKFQRDSQAVLFNNHPRKRPVEPEDIAKVDADKALAFYKDRFGDASDFTFVIVGAVDLDKLKPLVETYLASLPAKGRKEKEKDLGIRKIGGVVKKSWAVGQEPKARVAMTFHGDETWTRDKDRDLRVLGQVLSIRLREILREDMGGVYGVGAGGSIVRSPHQERMFTISFGCAPENVDKLVKAASDEIAKIAKDGIGAEYLEKVKATYLREREVSLRNNATWVGWLGVSARYGDDPTVILDPSHMLARMTSDLVKASAKHYLDGKQYYQAVMLPAAP